MNERYTPEILPESDDVPDFETRQDFDRADLADESVRRAFSGVIEHHRVDDGIDALEIMPMGVFESGTQIDVALLTPGEYPPHYHEKSAARIYVLKGSGFVYIGDEKFEYKKGSEFVFPKDTDHGFTVTSETSFLSIQDQPIMGDDGPDFHRRDI